MVRTHGSSFPLYAKLVDPLVKNQPKATQKQNTAICTGFRVKGLRLLQLFLLRYEYLKVDTKAYYVCVFWVCLLYMYKFMKVVHCL